VARTAALADGFFAEHNYLEHWKVSDYAHALGVTPTHLSRVARRATGEPLARLIAARLMREARRNLAYTSMSVTTVAYALGFSDPAYFKPGVRPYGRCVPA
jgi:AraC family transcriptional activator of pobA